MNNRKHRDAIYGGLVVKVAFGWADRRTDESGDTYRFDFYLPGSTLATSIGPDRKRIAGFDVAADQVKYMLSDLEDAAKSLRRHLAEQQSPKPAIS